VQKLIGHLLNFDGTIREKVTHLSTRVVTAVKKRWQKAHP